MTTHDLAPFVTTFFTRHLPAERNASPHTIAAYRDTLKLLLRFLAASMHRSAAALQESAPFYGADSWPGRDAARTAENAGVTRSAIAPSSPRTRKRAAHPRSTASA